MNASAQNSPFKAQGRISRITFFSWNIILFIVLIVIIFAAIFLFVPTLNVNTLEMTIRNHPNLSTLLFLIIFIPFFYMNIIICIKRLHDLNYSGWLVLLNFIPIISTGFSVYITFAAGTSGSNKFGEQRAPKTWESAITWIIIGLLSFGVIFAIFAGIPMQ